MSKYPCEYDGCSKDSDVLLTDGNYCWEHGHEKQPETTEYLSTVGKAVVEDE